MNNPELPTYEVEEVSFEEAVLLLLVNEDDTEETVFTKVSERLMELIAA